MSDETIFYVMEADHLAKLKAIAKRLYTEERMDGNQMRDLAHTITAVVRYAEGFEALRGCEDLKHLYPQARQPSAAYYEITGHDVHKAIITAFGREWTVSGFLGRIMKQDIGKRVFLRGDVLQVENDEQFRARLRLEMADKLCEKR